MSRKIKITSSTWAGTSAEETYDLSELGIREDITEDQLSKDKNTLEDLLEIAIQQQHFEWNFELIDE